MYRKMKRINRADSTEANVEQYAAERVGSPYAKCSC